MASGEESVDVTDLGSDNFLESLLDSYERMEMPLRRYLLLILVPSFVFLVFSFVVAFGFSLPLYVSVPVPLLGLLILGTAAFYPKVQHDAKRAEIENRLHLLITHMTVLSTTNIDRMEVFRKLAKEREYGELSVEIERIVKLVDVWNQSLDDACRRRAREVPSRHLGDFLDRLAYSMGAGQELADFLLREQGVIIQNYVTIYEGSLDNLEVMKDLYLSMILSMTFALVFAVVLPVLTGTDPTLSVAAVITMYVFVQTGFFLAIRSITPYDPVWYQSEEISSEIEQKLQLAMAGSVVFVLILIILIAGEEFSQIPIALSDLIPLVDTIPFLFYAAIPVTPLVIPGVLFRIEEQKIKGRDEEFPSFIRALGASESAKQATTSVVLRTLRTKDFGTLTQAINNLYKRLNMRIENEGAWHHFTADTRSYLIQKFAEMYLVGRQMGGDPKQLGELISENMNEVIQLRERRNQATVTLIGLLYGITAASTFAFFIGLSVVEILGNMSLDLNTPGLNFATIINTQVYNIQVIEYFLLVVVLFNALMSALMIRTVDGGHKANAYIHLVVMVWLGVIVATATKVVVHSFLSV